MCKYILERISVQPNQLSAESIRTQLRKILSSSTFARSERLARFLNFTIDETLEGRGDQLKEFVIGVEVFDKTEKYDPRMDPIVRVEARRLREKLRKYYETEGRRAFRFLSELARAESEPDAPLFARLAAGFERYAGALTYMRKVYFRDTPLPWRGLATP